MRPNSEALDIILGEKFPVLDHGFIYVVDYMGNDAAIIQAARVSYGQGTRNVREDQGLLHYLMRHRHTTPFEMCEIKFHVKLPIFVARQWIRHRTASVNEYSARYSVLAKEFYIPNQDQIAVQSTTNKQGRSEALEAARASIVQEKLTQASEAGYSVYDLLLTPEVDLARELARMSLTLNYYTEWYWKVDLHNLFHFLQLRADPHAQYEIRVYADIMLKMVQAWVPMAYAAFVEHRLNAVTFSATGMEFLRRVIDGQGLIEARAGLALSEREFNEIRAEIAP